MGCLASAVPEVPIIGDRRSITRENCTEPSKSEAQVLALQAERRPESWVARAAEGGPAGALPCFRGQWEWGLASQPHAPPGAPHAPTRCTAQALSRGHGGVRARAAADSSPWAGRMCLASLPA